MQIQISKLILPQSKTIHKRCLVHTFVRKSEKFIITFKKSVISIKFWLYWWHFPFFWNNKMPNIQGITIPSSGHSWQRTNIICFSVLSSYRLALGVVILVSSKNLLVCQLFCLEQESRFLAYSSCPTLFFFFRSTVLSGKKWLAS